jgi:hypothetical protein
MDSRVLYEVADALALAANLIEPKDLNGRWFVDRLDELAEEVGYAARDLAEQEEDLLRRRFAKLEQKTSAREERPT